MKMLSGLLLASSLVFFGCAAQEKEFVFVEPERFEFQKPQRLKSRSVRVHPDDAPLYEAYIEALRGQIDFLNAQIDDYFEVTKKGEENE